MHRTDWMRQRLVYVAHPLLGVRGSEGKKKSQVIHKRSNQTGNTVGVGNGLMLCLDGTGTVLHCAVLHCALRCGAAHRTFARVDEAEFPQAERKRQESI